MQVPTVIIVPLAAVLLVAACAPVVALDIGSLRWQRQPTWLGNPTAKSRCGKTPDGVSFQVDGVGKGMKWSAPLAAPIDTAKTPWLLIRYRAIGFAPSDYAVSVGIDAGDFTTLLPCSELVDDGAWHCYVTRLDALQADTVAVHVQCESSRARLELSRLEFSKDRPELSVRDIAGLAEAKWGKRRAVDISFLCNTTPEAMKSAWHVNDWLPDEVSIGGVPFRTCPGPKSVAAISSDVTVPLSDARSSEVCFLIGAVKTADRIDPPLTEPHAFYALAEYADGTSDKSIPARLPGSFGLAEGIGAYVVGTDPGKTLKQITLHAQFSGLDAYLIAATAGQGPLLARYALPEVACRAVPYEPAKSKSSGETWRLEVKDSELTFTDGTREVAIALKPKLSVKAADTKSRISWSSPLWTLDVNGKKLSSEDFRGRVASSGVTSASIELADTSKLGITGTLEIGCAEPGKLRMKLSLETREKTPLAVVFPTVQGLRHNGHADLWYCFPKRSSVINKAPVDLREPYSGAFPLQFMDISGPRGGVYLMTEDLANTYRSFHLTKTSDVTMEVEYPQKNASGFESVSSVIGFHDGDWHAALDAYKAWLATWYKPAAPRKQWFREVFNLRQQFLRFYATDGTYFDGKTNKFTFMEGLERDRGYFGGVDYLHILDWGLSPTHGLGDYSPWSSEFTLQDFRKAVEQTQASGVPVGLYIEGYLASLNSEIGKAHGQEWDIINQAGKPVRAYGLYSMCPAIKPWQDHLASVYGRVNSEIGADGYYIDEYGYGFEHFRCYSPNHGHEVPTAPLKGEREVMSKIRKALGPDKLFYTEYPPTDVQSQLLDGAFEKAVCFGLDELTPSRINLTRFALPDFKTFEIVMLDEPLGDRRHDLGLVFFNGEGLWIEGPGDKWYSPQALELIRKTHRITREFRDCFTSLSPVALVPTGHPRVFANQFPGKKRTLWTLYNSSHSTVRGEPLAVRHVDGARYTDIWNDNQLKPRIHKGIAYLTLSLGPKEVGCVVQELP